MKKGKLNPNYWENNYLNQNTDWDIGYASPPIVNYFEKIVNKNISILIPGAGNAYEAEYLFKLGFKNITVLDYATQPLINLQKRIPTFPDNQLVQDDFFNHHKKYDIIIEQTFFCALNPVLRASYAAHMHRLLHLGGSIIGVLFNFPLSDEGPPFGGSVSEYKKLFSTKFEIKVLELCYNSIKPRQGNELFIIFEKKIN
ncbi:MAG: TPMT family class I SAM-dependent methyltransferase [Flavobacteriaceae bacterium]|nr:TPMT family class I SAM-dependent methyltransferase [Flavobacteriaceae bacterium]